MNTTWEQAKSLHNNEFKLTPELMFIVNKFEGKSKGEHILKRGGVSTSLYSNKLSRKFYGYPQSLIWNFSKVDGKPLLRNLKSVLFNETLGLCDLRDFYVHGNPVEESTKKHLTSTGMEASDRELVRIFEDG